MTDLTNEQIAVALDEQVYRRSSTEQQLTDADINVTSINLSADSSFPEFFSYEDGYYYNNDSGFVGRIVQASNGKVFVVFRGSDLSGTFTGDGLHAMFTTPAPSVDLTVADPYDWNDNYFLGMGTLQRTQLDDALALLELAKKQHAGADIIVTGQSLGGGRR